MSSNYVQLGEVIAIHDSRRIPLSSMDRMKRQGVYPYHGATEIMDYVDDYIFDGLYLLLAEDGSVINEDGSPVLQLVDGKFWVNNHAHVITGGDDLDTRFLFYSLSMAYVAPWITGAVQLKINQRWMKKIEIFYPNRKTREFIVNRLKILDDAIFEHNSLVKKTKEIMFAIFRSWFIDFDMVENNINKAKIVHVSNHISEKFPNSFVESDLGMIPENWKVVSLADCIQANARVGWKGLSVDEYTDSGPHIVTGPQLIDGSIVWNKCGHVPYFRYEESPEIMLQENDVLLTKDGTIGKVALVHSMPGDATLAAGLFKLRARKEICGHGFVYCLLNSYLFDSLVWTRVEGAVIPHLYQTHLRAFKFAIPDKTLMMEFEKVISPFIEIMKNSNRTISILEQSKKTLLKRFWKDEISLN